MAEAFEIMENEWMHLFDVGALEKKPLVLTLSPDDEERKRLAQRLGVLKLESLKADLKIMQEQGAHRIHIAGEIQADLVQACVVTLEPISVRIEDSFEAWYADPESAVSFVQKRREKESRGGQTEVKMLEEQEDPEPIINGKIDLGELVTQYLSLAINPYPHAEGVDEALKQINKSGDGDDDEAFKPHNPFAALKDWKDKL